MKQILILIFALISIYANAQPQKEQAQNVASKQDDALINNQSLII